ncbi:reverse transcriptase domain-containing protein, partial [Tanacetum coccineum]
MKAITTRSGEPRILLILLLKSSAQIPPPVILISILEPDVLTTLPKTTPIPESDILKSLPKSKIPYPPRRDDQKSRDKASNQMEKIFQIFQDLCFDISFADALLLMPRFAPTIKSFLMNKEKLLELAKIPLNENCSAVLLKKLPEKLRDLGKFLIPCNFPGMDVCHALADLGASINLMPLSIWKKLSLPELTPTRMTLELADRSITYPKGLAERQIEVYLKDDSISLEIDHADCNPEEDICLIKKLLNNDPFQLPPMDLKQSEVTEAKSSIEEPLKLELKDLPSHLEYAFLEENDKLPVIIAKGFKNDEKDALLKPVQCVPKKGGITVVANEENELISTRLMIERLAGNEFYCFLDGFSGYFQIPIDPQDQEKTTFTCPYGTFAYCRIPFGLCNAPGTFQWCMMAIFHDMIEKTMELFMDDFSVFGDSFDSCLSNFEKMLKRCEYTNLVLNWKKCHFMCKEGIVLGHKISKSRIEVDRAKVDVIAKLPHSTTVKGVRSFLGHAGFYRRFIQDFSKIARTMSHLLEKETPFLFSKDCIDAFQTLKKKLTEAP